MKTPIAEYTARDQSWCTVLLESNRVRASLEHIGRGRFRVIEDEDDGKYIGQIIDASDILNCLT